MTTPPQPGSAEAASVQLRHNYSYSRYRPHTRLAAVLPLRPGADAAALISEFGRRYNNTTTRHQYVAELTALFASTRPHAPEPAQ